MNWSFPTSAKQTFIDGWTKYVKPGGWSPQPAPADYYWNPRAGNWYLYPVAAHTIEDKGWPQTDLSSFLTQPGPVYDQITKQYHDLPDPSEPYAFWDPRTGKWMSIARKSSTSGKSAALAKLLADVAELPRQGYLSVHATAEIQTMVQREM